MLVKRNFSGLGDAAASAIAIIVRRDFSLSSSLLFTSVGVNDSFELLVLEELELVDDELDELLGINFFCRSDGFVSLSLIVDSFDCCHCNCFQTVSYLLTLWTTQEIRD